MTEALISLSDVDLRLGSGANAVHVLKSVNLVIARGESVGVVGPSGSGKTTLLMVLSGLEKPDSGVVRIAGASFNAMREDAIAAFRGQNIGIVFQSFHLIPNMTALENVAIPLEFAGTRRCLRQSPAAELAGGRSASHRLTSLSRVSYPAASSSAWRMARALVAEPKICCMADEPTGNLDGATGHHISDLLFAKQRERGMTFVLVTHDQDLAAECNRQVGVDSGRVEERGDLGRAAE